MVQIIKTEILSKTFLFSGIDIEEILKLLKEIQYRIKEYKRGELIFTPEIYEKEIGFVISGKCDITRKKSENSFVTLNTIAASDSFGILAVLSAEEEFPSYIKARTAAQILFIARHDFYRLADLNPQISRNVMSFLASRITFLNRRIATFSADSVEEKIANYILTESEKHNSLEIPFNCKLCAEMTNSGRASVYRALTVLTDSGAITFSSKKIIIIDRKGLERTKK